MSIIEAATGGERKGFSVSRMTEHDLLEVVAIEESTGLSRWGWEAYHAELSREREAIMLVVRSDDRAERASFRVIGFIAARIGNEELHINNMAVRKDWRQRGIGALLLGTALEEGKRRGARRAFLEVRASNGAAQALYGRMGFRSTARRPRYYTDPTEDALVMTAAL